MVTAQMTIKRPPTHRRAERNGNKGIGDCEDAREKMDRLASQTGGIPAAVEFLMVLTHDCLGGGEKLYALNDA